MTLTSQLSMYCARNTVLSIFKALTCFLCLITFFFNQDKGYGLSFTCLLFHMPLITHLVDFLFTLILLVYSCFTMLCSFLLYGKMNQPQSYIHPLLFGLPSNSDPHSALSRVPCDLQYSLISYLLYIENQQCICINPNHLSPTNPCHPQRSICLFSTPVCLFLLGK